MTPDIPGFIHVIPGFIHVIPAKAGIQTDSLPEPHCPVPPLALSTPTSLSSFPRRRESTLTHHQNRTARCPLGLVIPDFTLVIHAKAGIHTDSPPEPNRPVPPGLVIPETEIRRWRWIPAFAGMTTSEHGNEPLEFCDNLRAWERVVGVLQHPRQGGEQSPLAYEGIVNAKKRCPVPAYQKNKTLVINMRRAAGGGIHPRLITPYRTYPQTAQYHPPPNTPRSAPQSTQGQTCRGFPVDARHQWE